MSPDMLMAEPAVVARGGSWLSRVTRSNAFAWILSVILHAVVFLAFYRVVFREKPTARRDIIPEARLAVTPSPALPRSTTPLNLSRQPAAAPVERSPLRVEELPVAAVTLAEPPALALPGKEKGAQDISPASTAVSTLLPNAPVARFFGQTGNAYKVVYVVDVSASLMTETEGIIKEMRDSIRALVPSQKFHIILARSEVEEFEPARLVPATGVYKTQAYSFLTRIQTPKAGAADVIRAMERAFQAKPELIYFLSDGDYFGAEGAPGESPLEQALKQLNAAGEVKITVIGFHPSRLHRPLLERIAREHRGNLRIVRDE